MKRLKSAISAALAGRSERFAPVADLLAYKGFKARLTSLAHLIAKPSRAGLWPVRVGRLEQLDIGGGVVGRSVDQALVEAILLY
jgi:hypothetical protein